MIRILWVYGEAAADRWIIHTLRMRLEIKICRPPLIRPIHHLLRNILQSTVKFPKAIVRRDHAHIRADCPECFGVGMAQRSGEGYLRGVPTVRVVVPSGEGDTQR